MRKLNSNPRVDNSDPSNYPNGRIKDNDGSGNGTSVNERVYGDLHQMKEKLMLLYGIIANDLPDNETNGYQLIDALIALASKNDYVLDLTTTGGVLQIPVKVALMKTGESLICKASADKTTETEIKGSDNSQTVVTFSGNFKENEYVRFIKTSLGVTLVRIADNTSLNAMATELLFLKKASYAQELAGTIDTVATTPQTNALVFTERVNGASSSVSLATAIRNGLYPKDHFAIVAALAASPVKNTGWFSGLNIASSSGSLAVSGGVGDGKITAANASSNVGGNETNVTVTMSTAMSGTNYKVNVTIQSESSDIYSDNDICMPVWKPISSTQFLISFKETATSTQSLKVHLEVVQL